MLSRNLEQTLHRALAAANQRSHEYATLEHLLLALIEDQDAMAVLRSCGISLTQLRLELEGKRQNRRRPSNVFCNAPPSMCNLLDAKK
jgi:ATP-dependent Clp protease ATP-binding subunit ClpA